MEQTTVDPQAEHRVIARNFVWLSSAQVGLRVVQLFTSIYVRRILGAVVIGQYSWCRSALSYFSLLSNLGLGLIAERDAARDASQAARIFSQLLALQLVLAALALGMVGLFVVTGWRGPVVGQLLALSAVGLLISPFNLTWLLHAQQRMAPASIGRVSAQILTLPALIWLVHEPEHVMRYVILEYPFQLGLIAFLFWYAARNGLLRWPEVRPSFSGTWPLIKESLPLGLSRMATLLYYNFDVIFLGFWSGDRVVGLYSTAYSAMLIPTFLSGSLSSAYFPQFSRVYGNEEQSVKLSSAFLRVLIWMGLPLAALGWAFGRYGVVLLYGRDFSESGPLLEWLALDLALIFFNAGLGTPCEAWGLQRPRLKVTCAAALLNVALNCLFIPRFGAWAAIVTTLLAEVVVGVGSIWIIDRCVRLPLWRIAATPLLVSLAAALIGRYLAFTFPTMWFLSLIMVTCAVLAAYWVSERNSVVNLFHNVCKAVES